MNPRKIYLLAFVLLLITAGLVLAQSSTNYTVQRTTMSSGETVASPNYKVNTVIGQPATNVVNSANYQVSAGFLFPLRRAAGFETHLPVILR